MFRSLLTARTMKINIITILFIISTTVNARVLYVSTNGDDNRTAVQATNISTPWASWGKAFRNAISGDTVYFRGGVYYVSATDQYGQINNDGTDGNLINFWNYPGEEPILDFSQFTFPNKFEFGIRVWNDDYLSFKGFTIRNMWQNPADSTIIEAFEVQNSHHIYIENIKIHHIGGAGLLVHACDEVYIKNCDTWECCDTLAKMPGNYGTGIGVGSRVDQDARGLGMYDTHYYIEGCRAWSCGDQGFTQDGVGYHEWKNCWSFNNGRFTGEGWGMKLSIGTASNSTNSLSRVIKNCIFAVNASSGINPNNVGGNNFNGIYHNNFIYYNGYKPWTPYYENSYIGCGIWICNYIQTAPAPNEMYINNISYKNDKGDVVAHDAYTHMFNSWDHPDDIKVADDDFISLDWMEMLNPRKQDGSLPEINFGKLAPGSDLIDAGSKTIITRDFNIALPYNGSAPDLGWHESSSATNPPTQSIPEYQYSVVDNNAPNKLVITYNLTLANIIPAPASFTVKVNSTVRDVTIVTISDTNITLTLSSPIVHGDVVTVAYTKPLSYPIQTTSGGQAASFTEQIVTNNVTTSIPIYISSEIQNSTPSRLDMSYSLSLANVVPAVSAFSIKVNNVTRSVSTVVVSGTEVLLTLASPVIYGDVVTVAYAKPASSPLQTAVGGQAASITAQNVTNNVGSINQPPVVSISSPIKSSSFIAPATITIDANASDPDGSVIKVEFYSGTSKLGEITAIPYAYTWKEVPAGTYSLTAVATDNQGLRTFSTAVTVVVEKSATVVNQLPSVSIKIPNEKKPKKHDNVVIIAEASDPDGTISKVELKSGNVTIAEMTTAPYVYIMQNVDTGTYLISATATDNLGAVSISDAIELRVEDFYNPDLISLYPNPNNGFFKIDILEELPDQQCSLSIVGLTGTTVYQDKVTSEEISKEIRLPDLQSGPYVVMLTNGNTILTTKKFIKQ